MARRGRITIPVELRHKYGITEGMQLEVLGTEQRIVFRKERSTLGLAGSGKATVERVFELLGRMRGRRRQIEEKG